MFVNDRSGGTQGNLVRGQGAPTGCSPIGDGPLSQQARIPSNRNYTEVAITEGEGENCSAVTADTGGDAGEGHVNQAHKVVADKALTGSGDNKYLSRPGITVPSATTSGPVPDNSESGADTILNACEKSHGPVVFNGGKTSMVRNTVSKTHSRLTMSEVAAAKRNGTFVPEDAPATSGMPQERQGQGIVKSGPAHVVFLDGKMV